MIVGDEIHGERRNVKRRDPPKEQTHAVYVQERKKLANHTGHTLTAVSLLRMSEEINRYFAASDWQPKSALDSSQMEVTGL